MVPRFGKASLLHGAHGEARELILGRTRILLQLRAGLEVVPQALSLSALLCYSADHPGKKWLNWLLGVLFFLMVALLVMGLLVRH